MDNITIEICYAQPGLAVLRNVNVPVNCTVQQAILQSGILQDVQEIDLSCSRVGIYGKLKTLETIVREHDRVEIYRPLIADPKDARRTRAGRRVASS